MGRAELERELEAARTEIDALRTELEATRSSASFRLGHALVRGARRVLPRRSPGATDLPARSSAGTEQPRTAPAAPPSETAAATPATDATTGADVPDAAERSGPVDAAGQLVDPGPPPAYEPPRPPAKVHLRPTIEHPPLAATPDQVPAGPLFTGGTGRSGTWIHGRLLGHHPAWFCVPTELRFHSVPSGFRAVLAGERDPEEFARGVRRRWHRITTGSGNAKGLQLLVTPKELSAHISRFRRRAEADVADALGQLLLDVIEPYARGRGALGWVETTPANAESAHALLTCLPSAKLLHSVRDGRDVAASVVKMPWGPDTIEEALDWWASRVLAAHRGTQPVADRVLTVPLEEFTALDRDRWFDEVMAFCGFTDPTAIREHFDTEVDGRAGNVGRWRGQVGAAERDRIDGRYRELIEQLRELQVTCLPTDPDRVDELARQLQATTET